MDLLFMSGIVLLFVVIVGMVLGCDKLMGRK